MLLVLSCGAPAYLITDETFRAASPEILAAWSAQPPWHPVSALSLVQPTAGALDQLLTGLPDGASILVGATLPEGAAQDVTARHPRFKLRFFGPPIPGAVTLGIDRAEAWAAVARSSAVPQPAAAVFPPQAPPVARDRFLATWKAAGGGPLEELPWPPAGVPAGETIFDGGGAETAGWRAALPPGITVNGDPGVSSPGGRPGLTWAVRTEGLGDFLWEAARKSGKDNEILPVESVPARR
jgi:hypothetical protein